MATSLTFNQTAWMNTISNGYIQQSVGANGMTWAAVRKARFLADEMLLVVYCGSPTQGYAQTWGVHQYRRFRDDSAMCERWEFLIGPQGAEPFWWTCDPAILAIEKDGTTQYATDEANWRYMQEPTCLTRTPTSEEDTDMAQRQNFTFTYTGSEIAKAIDAKIREIKDSIKAIRKLDLDALVEAKVITGGQRQEQESKIKGFETSIATWEKEQRPYAKAGAQTFDLDAEDVEHFGL